MKKIIFLTIFIAAVTSAIAQEQPVTTNPITNKHELGVILNSFNVGGLRYKYGNDKKKLRVSLLATTGQTITNNYNTYKASGTNLNIPNSPSNSFSVGLNIGVERNCYNEGKMASYLGFEMVNSFSSSYSSTNLPSNTTYSFGQNYYAVPYSNLSTSNAWTLNLGLGLLAGIKYHLTNAFSVGFEFIPTASYKYTETTNTSISRTVGSFQYNSNNILIGYSIYDYLNIHSFIINKGMIYSLTGSSSIALVYKFKA